MIDGLLGGLRRAGERVQRRGEEVAQATRLRLEIFQLGRELDALYARLGRAYHGNAEVSALEGVREDIARVDGEISARERLLSELGTAGPELESASPGALDTDLTATDPSGVAVPGTAVGAAATTPSRSATVQAVSSRARVTTASPETLATQAPAIQGSPAIRSSTAPSAPSPVAGAALSVWREKEEARMSDSKESVRGSVNQDPTVVHSDEKPPVGQGSAGDWAVGVGDEKERDRIYRHPNELHEGEMASLDPDPLADKD